MKPGTPSGSKTVRGPTVTHFLAAATPEREAGRGCTGSQGGAAGRLTGAHGSMRMVQIRVAKALNRARDLGWAPGVTGQLPGAQP